jgi:hypothetical protein
MVMVMRNVAIFYACSAATIIILVLLALHNRKIGWKRNRIDAAWLPVWQLFDDLTATSSPGAPASRLPPPEPEELRTQLLALNATLAALDQRRFKPTHQPRA